MLKRLFIFTSVMSLALVSLTEAGPRPRPAAPAPSHLTEVERLCQTVGKVAYNAVSARDTGVSYFQLLEDYRRLIAQRRATSAFFSVLATRLDGLILGNLRMVYDTPSVTPADNRHVIERLCLQTVEDSLQTSNTQSTTDRY